MRLFRSTVFFILSLLMTILLVQCGSDPAQEGTTAFENGNYSQAINFFLQVKKDHPERTEYDEKIALSYMFHGRNIYNNRKNLNSFSGNFDKATGYIPVNPSEAFKKEYSKVLFDLALAYHNSKAQNEIQKEDYFNKTLEYLESAIYEDESNTSADSMLTSIKQTNFQKMLDRGKDFFEKARKQNKADLYVSAEFYLKRATDFDPYNDEAGKLLSQVRIKTLPVLVVRDDLAIAVADYLHQGNSFIVDLALHNYTRDAIAFDVTNLVLITASGEECQPDPNTIAKFSDALANQSIPMSQTLNGKYAFQLARGEKAACLEYRLDSKIMRKYFP
jgi:tetratricopeptide (TPR) repeat protein